MPRLEAIRTYVSLHRAKLFGGAGVPMAMTSCSECGSQISTAARSCPMCGLPDPFSTGHLSLDLSVDADPQGFNQAVKACFQKYAVFSGRARRAELWWFVLLYFLCRWSFDLLEYICLETDFWPPRQAVFNLMFFKGLGLIVRLGFVLPLAAVWVRRMHDNDLSGWWGLIPVYSGVLALTDGTAGSNRYGPDPKGRKFSEGQPADSQE